MEIFIIAEGQTEEQFIKRVVAPSLHGAGLHMKPLLMRTSRDGQGGAISFDRLKFNARNTLRQHPDAWLGTFIDLYALDTSFPDFRAAMTLADVYARVQRLESSLHAAVVESVGCRPGRFVPHIQPYEFEGLLFADVRALSGTESGWASRLDDLARVRDSFESPEHINDGYDTKPSRRLQDLLSPRYHKTRHGPLAAQRVTLATMEAECTHFRQWMNALRALAAT